MKARQLMPETLSFLLWLAFWSALGWVVGFTFDGHFWIVIPINCSIHGFIVGVIFAVLSLRRRRKIGRISPGSGALFGAAASVIALGLIRLLTWFSLYIPLVVIPLDALFGLLLSVLLLRGARHDAQLA
jgi:hypothetical protein